MLSVKQTLLNLEFKTIYNVASAHYYSISHYLATVSTNLQLLYLVFFSPHLVFNKVLLLLLLLLFCIDNFISILKTQLEISYLCGFTLILPGWISILSCMLP